MSEGSSSWIAPLVRRIQNAQSIGEVLRGCSDAEVTALENRYGVAFPAAYKTVLRSVGHTAPGFLDPREFHFYHEQLLTLTHEVRIRAAHSRENIPALEHYPPLPRGTFVVRGRDMEQFELIFCHGGEEAPVHYFTVDDGQLVLAYPSVQAWFERLCNDELR
jgi:hypothetical protein